MSNYDLENKKLREGLIEFWREGKFSDLTLKTTDGKTFLVHKIIICSISKYFQAMICSDFAESNKDIVELDENIKSEDLEFTLEFIYTGKLEFLNQLEWQNALSLYKTVIFLNLDALSDSVLNLLLHQISNENCLVLWNLKDEQYKKLQSKSEDYIGQNIQWIFQNQSEKLSHAEILRILTINNLNCSDQELYLQLMKWVKINFEDRQKYLKDILSKINFENLGVEFIEDNILNDDILHENPDFLKIIAQNLCSKMKNMYNNCQYYYGLNKNEYRLLITKNSFFKIHMEHEEIIELKKFKMAPYFAATEFKENKIFFSGGKGSNECKYFANEMFHPLPSISHERSYHSSIYYNEKIYCCAGWCDSNRTTEIFDLNSMKWIQGPTMICTMWTFGLIEKDAVLYAFNVDCADTGYNEIIQRLDTRTDYWKTLKNTISRIKTRTNAIVFEDKIYVFTPDQCFSYDIESNTLHEICKFPSRFNYVFEAFKFRNSLCIIGTLSTSNQFTCLKFNKGAKKFENYAVFPEYSDGCNFHIF